MRLLVNRLFNFVFSVLLMTKISDLTFGYKMLTRNVGDSIDWKSDRHEVATETTIMPIALGYRVEEVPVSWIRRKYGKSSFRFSYNFQYVKIALRAVLKKWVGAFGLTCR